MLHLYILRATGWTNFQSFLKETQQKALQHPAYIGELAAWLNQFGLASEAFTWLHGLPPQLAGQGLIPLALADSYVALRQWKDPAMISERRFYTLQVRIARSNLSASDSQSGAAASSASC